MQTRWPRFPALKSTHKGDEVPVKEVENLVRQKLLARCQALRLTNVVPSVAKYLPAFHQFLLNYPQGLDKDEAKNLEKFFYWLNIDVFGRPTYVLVHRISYHLGEAAFAVERQYYASHDYSSMLQGIAALSNKDGTFLFYIGRMRQSQFFEKSPETIRLIIHFHSC
jgi:hypothetical protein